MRDLKLRTRGLFRYIVSGGNQNRRQWTRALFILLNGVSDAAIIIDMQETDYEALDIPDTKLTVPLKQFRVCHKRVLSEDDRTPKQIRKHRGSVTLIQPPIFQIHLSSRIVFAKKHLWIGFLNKCEYELWFTTLHTLITQRTHVQCLKSSDSGSSLQWDVSQPSELDFLASALPCMLDNEIYESTSVSDTYQVSVIQTEKARELGLVGRYLLRITPMAFELLDTLYHATIQVWPLRYIRKFGVYMKRLYLICGSGCHQGKGLFIFLVQDESSIQNKLLELVHHPPPSSILSRRCTHSHTSGTPLIPNEVANENTKSGGYWFETDQQNRHALSTPVSPADLSSMTLEAKQVTSHPGHAYPVMSPKRTPIAVSFETEFQLSPSRPSTYEQKQAIGKWFTEGCSQTSTDSNSMNWNEDMPQEEADISEGMQTPTTIPRGILMHCTVRDDSQSGVQPVYENTNDLTSSLQEDDKEVSGNEEVGEKGKSEEKVEKSRSKMSTEKRSWKPTCLFEPIEEKEERVSRSESGSTIKIQEDDNPIVTSSTPGDEILEDELFGSDAEGSEENEKTTKRDELVPQGTRFRRFVTRSATWDGWLYGKPMDFQSPQHKVVDATVQTEEENESTHSGSDIIVRTTF